MTAATLNHTQTRTFNTGATPFRVVDVINSSTGFPLSPGAESVFVFKVLDGLFDHVATVLDMQTYLTSLVAAQGANNAYYRLASVTKDFANVELASDFAATLISRMTSLCHEYDITTTSFVGVTGPVTLP